MKPIIFNVTSMNSDVFKIYNVVSHCVNEQWLNSLPIETYCVHIFYCDLVVCKWTIQRAGIVDWALKRPLAVYSDGIS